MQPIARRDVMDDRFERNELIGRQERIIITKVDFVLTGSLFVMGAFRPNAHLFERQADFPPYIFALVHGSDVQIAGVIMRLLCRVAFGIGFKEIEFAFGANLTMESVGLTPLDGLTQNSASIPCKGTSIRMQNIAEHANDAPLLWPPRQNR